MNLNLFSYNGIKEKVDKSLTNVQSNIDCRLLDVTDITEPVITVEVSNNVSMSDLMSCNYCQITDFNRYYYIDKKEIDTNNIIIYHLKSDPLFSFNTDIKTWSGEVEELDDQNGAYYMQDQTGVKGTFGNDNYKCSVNGITEYWSVDGSFDVSGHDTITNSSVVLVFSGYNSVSSAVPNFIDPLQTGFFSAYASGDSLAGIRSFADKFWGLDPATVVTSALLRPIDSCISMHILPFRPSGALTTEVNAGYMSLTLDANVIKLGSSYKQLNLGTIEIIPSNKTADFRYYPPYRNYKIFLPFIGLVDLNPSEFLVEDASGLATRCLVNVLYDVNMLTGDFICTLRAGKTSMGTITQWYNMNTHQGNMAVKLPVTGADAASLASGCLNAVNTFTTMATGGNANGADMMFSAGGIQKGNMSGNTMYMGSNTSFWYSPRLYMNKPAKIIGPQSPVNGYPFVNGNVLSINDLRTSYNLQDNHYFKYKKVCPLMSTGMTTSECDEVIQILEGGCYL